MTQLWTPAEIEILRREYPTGGSNAVRKFLPERCLRSIATKANKLQVKMPGRKSYQHQPASEWIDATLQRAYRTGKPDLKAVAKACNRTHGWVKWRAQCLGLCGRASGTPTGPWTPAEIALLDDCMEQSISITMIYQRFKAARHRRSLTAIRARIEKLSLGWNRDFWTATDVARAFGVENHRPVSWIQTKKLKAVLIRGLGHDDQPAKETIWRIELPDVREFMLYSPECWDHRKMNKEVLLDLLCGGEHGLITGAFGNKVSRNQSSW